MGRAAVRKPLEELFAVEFPFGVQSEMGMLRIRLERVYSRW